MVRRTRRGKRPYLDLMIRFGVAGWDYTDWWGPVYPADRKGKRSFDPLAYLARFFDTIEINSSFYRPPAERSAASWARRVAENPDFRFTAKLYKRFTHERDRAWTVPEVDDVRRGMTPLAEAGRLGCLLVQFPWSFKRDAAGREWLGDLVEAFAEFPLAIEVRHSSWNVPEFYATLRERGIGAVNIDQPVFRHSIKPGAEVTGPIGYVRLHGRNYEHWFRENAESHERYDYLYTKEELEAWLDRIHEVARQAHDTYVITNNHYRGQAPTNALMLRQMAGQDTAVPLELQQAFREAFASVAIDGAR
jgi:uncharacterized protein YecE (DUF72 family)